MRIYLDSSVLVKKFSKEEGSEIVENLFKKCESCELVLVVSQWTINECITAFDKSFKRGETDPHQMNSDIIDLVSLIENLKRKGHVDLVPIDDAVITQSAGFIRFNHLSADDSLHALCAMLGSSNMLLMHDNRFSYWLKHPDIKTDLEEDPRPKYLYHVINIGEPADLNKLHEELAKIIDK